MIGIVSREGERDERSRFGPGGDAPRPMGTPTEHDRRFSSRRVLRTAVATAIALVALGCAGASSRAGTPTAPVPRAAVPAPTTFAATTTPVPGGDSPTAVTAPAMTASPPAASAPAMTASPTAPPTPTVLDAATMGPWWTPTGPPVSFAYWHGWTRDGREGWLTASLYWLYPVRQVTPPADWGMPCRGIILHTPDGGASWREEYAGDVQVGEIQFADARTGWAIGRKSDCTDRRPRPGALLRTTDGGAHWRELRAWPDTLTLSHLGFTSDRDGWLLVDNGPADEWSPSTWRLLITHDGGDTWTERALPARGQELDLSHPTTADVWIAVRSDDPWGIQVLATHDDGGSWQALPTPVDLRQSLFLRISFLDAHRGWLLGGGVPATNQEAKELFGTTDGGRNWTKLSEASIPGGRDLGDLPFGGFVEALRFATPSEGWLLLGRAGLFRTVDGGRDWQWLFGDDASDIIASFDLAPSRAGWAIAPGGPLRVTRDGGATWRTVPLPIYPCPTQAGEDADSLCHTVPFAMP